MHHSQHQPPAMSVPFQAECPFDTEFGNTFYDGQVKKFMKATAAELRVDFWGTFMHDFAFRVVVQSDKLGKAAWDNRNRRRITKNLALPRGAILDVEIFFGAAEAPSLETYITNKEAMQRLLVHTLLHVTTHK